MTKKTHSFIKIKKAKGLFLLIASINIHTKKEKTILVSIFLLLLSSMVILVKHPGVIPILSLLIELLKVFL